MSSQMSSLFTIPRCRSADIHLEHDKKFPGKSMMSIAGLWTNMWLRKMMGEPRPRWLSGMVYVNQLLWGIDKPLRGEIWISDEAPTTSSLNHMERYGNAEGVGSKTCAILCKSKGCYYALLPQTGWPSWFLSKISLCENNLQQMWNASEEPRLNWSFQFSILIWCIRVASRKPRTAGSKLPLFILSGWKAD